jgi:hypothetical protein
MIAACLGDQSYTRLLVQISIAAHQPTPLPVTTLACMCLFVKFPRDDDYFFFPIASSDDRGLAAAKSKFTATAALHVRNRDAGDASAAAVSVGSFYTRC